MEASSRLTYEGYEAWIQVDGKELQCYSTDVDRTNNTVTCWIASEAGKIFSIYFRLNKSKIYGRVHAYLDGTRVRSTYCWDEKKTKHGCCFRAFPTSDTTEVPFMFSVLELTDDDNYLGTPLAANVGEIKLVSESITKPVLKDRRKYKSSENAKRTLPTVEKVHERSKKGMTHRINFGDERLKKQNFNKSAHYTAKEHLVTFIFRYRPLDILQANDIVPRIPDVPSQVNEPSWSPRGKTWKRKATHLKEEVQEDIKSFEDRESALLTELGRLKDEKEKFLLVELEKLRKDKYPTNDNIPRKKVKKETKPHLLSGEVIDLT